MSVRTRFAPSPTGYLHIGGVRTALFCWLFVRKNHGKFILRIDDTDQQRNVEEALEPILSGLRWLGIDWDEGPGVGGPYAPYYQSQRGEFHRAAAEKLLDAGAAYYDYATTEEVQREREAALREKRPFVYSRRFMAETPQDRARFEARGRQAVVRLKMPREGTLAINDLVRGRVEFEWAREQDHVIQRADASCLYHLASAVDDHDLKITHVIRAEEHLSNTPRQVFIARSLGYELPEYAHLPYVAEPGSKNKLSKRKLAKYLKNRDFAQRVEHGRKIAEAIGLQTTPESFNPVIVDFYRQVGYLPEAILNYLALLGWSLDDSTEHFTRQQLIEGFSLERINKAPASFDPQKLWAFQQRHMEQLPVEKKMPLVLPYLQKAGLVPDAPPDEAKAKVAAVLQAAGDRIKVCGDILDYAELFLPDDRFPYDRQAFDKRIRPAGTPELLRKFRERLAAAESFEPATLEELMHRFVELEGIQLSQIIHAVRVAVTGKMIGFGLFDTLATLGRQSSLARIDRALERGQDVHHSEG
jgi:glutamyl-tRNA synthetase